MTTQRFVVATYRTTLSPHKLDTAGITCCPPHPLIFHPLSNHGAHRQPPLVFLPSLPHTQRVWNFYLGNYYQLLEDPDKLLRDMRIYPFQQLLIEQQVGNPYKQCTSPSHVFSCSLLLPLSPSFPSRQAVPALHHALYCFILISAYILRHPSAERQRLLAV